MNNDKQKNSDGIILDRKQGITSYSSSLVRRGLEFVNQVLLDDHKYLELDDSRDEITAEEYNNLVEEPVEVLSPFEVISPMMGRFYRSPASNEPPFVEIGDRVCAGQTVCNFKAMNRMYRINACVSGQIIEILAQNGEPVEYGQALMRINPDVETVEVVYPLVGTL